MTETLPHPAAAATRPRSAFVAASALVGAAAVNLLLFAAGSAAGGAMAVHWPVVQAIAAPVVALASLVPTAAAVVVTGFVARRRPAFARFARWAGLAVAVGSMAAPLVAGDDLATKLALAPMHLVVGAAWFVAAGRLARR